MDAITIRLAIGALALVCLGCIGGMVFLAVSGKNEPMLGATLATATGALVGILVQQGKSPPSPQAH